ncbi:MAG: hypothetical protein ACLP1X_30225 [Polyangiaceae bacterium]
MTTRHLICIRSIRRAAFACSLANVTACNSTHEVPTAPVGVADAADDSHPDNSQPIVVTAPTGDGGCGAPCDDAGPEDALVEASAASPTASAAAGQPDAAGPTSELAASDVDADALSCAASFALCGGACTDLTGDANNCGACGHVCAPGACSDGECQRWAVATVDTSVLSLGRVTIATDGVNVVWLDPAQGVNQVPVVPATPNGEPIVLGPPTTGLNASTPQLGQIAMANGVVAWTETDPTLGLETWTALEGQAGSGSSTNVTGMVGCTGWGLAINATGTGVYFNSECTQGANLLGCNLGGADACSALGATDPSSSNGNDVAVAFDNVFVTDSANGVLWRYEAASGAFSQIETGQGDPFLLTVDSAFVYWASQGPNLMFTVSRTMQKAPTSPPKPVIAATGGVVTGIATDGTNLYLSGAVNSGSTRVGVVASVPVSGGAQLKNLYASADLPLAVATAGGVVVWLDGTDLGIYAIRP